MLTKLDCIIICTTYCIFCIRSEPCLDESLNQTGFDAKWSNQCRRSHLVGIQPVEEDTIHRLTTFCGRKRYKKSDIKFGAWNFSTLNDGDSRATRRSALIGVELKMFDMNVAALSETRPLDRGQLKELSSGYTYFWSGLDDKQCTESALR